MKVLLINEGALTDVEVLQLMEERKEQRLHKAAMAAYAERNWMDHKVLKYLHHGRSAGLPVGAIERFVRGLKRHKLQLSATEILQFINHRPTELVDIHLIVEDCAGRFSEEEITVLQLHVEQTLVPVSSASAATTTTTMAAVAVANGDGEVPQATPIKTTDENPEVEDVEDDEEDDEEDDAPIKREAA